MPNLLSINAYHYVRGGADVCYFEHAALFERQGWGASYFSMHHDENLPSPDSSYFAENIDYHKPGPKLQKLLHAGRIVYSFEARGKIGALLDSRRIDIAHVHNIYHHQSPSILAELKRRGIPTVMTAHDLKIACPNNKMMNRTGVCERCKGGKVWNVARFRCVQDSTAASTLIAIESAVHKALDLYQRNLDRIVTPSRFYRDKLIEWGWDADKIVHIPNFMPSLPQVEPTPGGDYLLYFGRLAPEKGVATLVRAAAISGIPVVVAGTGPEEAALLRLIAELDAPVRLVGFQKGDALWRWVDGARAVVLPSEWYENGPMSTIEAFARGKPLLGAAIGGIPELIVPGETGWSFPSGDAAALAAAMGRVLATSEGELGRMATATRRFASTEFAPSTYYERIEKLYAGLGVSADRSAR